MSMSKRLHASRYSVTYPCNGKCAREEVGGGGAFTVAQGYITVDTHVLSLCDNIDIDSVRTRPDGTYRVLVYNEMCAEENDVGVTVSTVTVHFEDSRDAEAALRLVSPQQPTSVNSLATVVIAPEDGAVHFLDMVNRTLVTCGVGGISKMNVNNSQFITSCGELHVCGVSNKGIVKIYDVERAQEMQSQDVHMPDVICATHGTDGHTVVAADARSIALVDTRKRDAATRVESRGTLCATGGGLVVRFSEGSITVYDSAAALTRNLSRTLPVQGFCGSRGALPLEMRVSPAGRHVMVVGTSIITVVDLEAGDAQKQEVIHCLRGAAGVSPRFASATFQYPTLVARSEPRGAAWSTVPREDIIVVRAAVTMVPVAVTWIRDPEGPEGERFALQAIDAPPPTSAPSRINALCMSELDPHLLVIARKGDKGMSIEHSMVLVGDDDDDEQRR